MTLHLIFKYFFYLFINIEISYNTIYINNYIIIIIIIIVIYIIM